MEETGEDKKMEEESCTDVQEESTHGIERMDIGKEVVPGATHIAYYGPVINIASGEAPITIGNIEQGATEINEPKNKLNDDFSELKKRYGKECAKHEVNCVEDGYITPLKLKIKDFAVNLCISKKLRSSAADDGFQGEMARHMESLKDHTHTIEVEELLNILKDDKHRIFFVGGVAGIGKSVLAKRIAYDWSCNEKYRNVKCLLYITCRELNEFLEKSDKEIGIEKIEKYLKEKFKDVPIEDDKATLFLIDGLDELQKHDLIQAFTEKFSESNFVILGRPHSRHFLDKTEEMCQNLMEKTSFEEDDEISYQLVEKLAEGKEVAKNRGDGVITYEDAKSVIRNILNQLPSKEVLLKVRFLADCFVASDKVLDVKFLEELLKSIKPSSNVEVDLDAFDQSNLLSILKLVTGNEVANSEIKNAFSGIEFRLHGLREMEILDYALWIDIDWVQFNNVNHFTDHQLMLVHRIVASCGGVVFDKCKVPLFTTNANESTTTMKLKRLEMLLMRIDQSEVSSAANLFCLAERVELFDVRVGGKGFEKIVEQLIQIKPRRLKRMDLWRCPLVNHDLKQKMKENGVELGETWPRSILLLCQPDSRNFVLQLKENLDDKNGYIAMDDNIEELKRRYDILVVFIQQQIPEDVERDILVAQNKRIIILLVKLEADFHPSEEMSSVFDSSPCLDFTDKRNNAEMPSEINRMVSALIDHKFIVISNAPGNQVEAIQIKQKFADEIGCPVFVNFELKKYRPRVVVVLLTDGYEESQQRKEMMEYYVKSFWKPKIIAVKLDNNFQPGDKLNNIVSWSTCICWTDETNFDANFEKVKEEINARFDVYRETYNYIDGDGKDAAFRTTSRVRQGGVESPCCFNLYLDFMVRIFEQQCRDEELGSKIKYRIENSATDRVQRGVPPSCSDLWCLWLRYSKEDYPKSICSLDGQQLKNVQIFKYLGQKFGFNEPYTADTELMTRKMSAITSFFKEDKFYKKHDISMETRRKIFDSLFRSKLTYAWSAPKASLDKISSAYASNLRSLVKGRHVRKRDTEGGENDDWSYKFTDNDIYRITSKNIIIRMQKPRNGRGFS
eukprot:gene14673-biopygen11769